jgi:hypothetical protein
MSDLHDAIREHLELKRAHGADPAEVARLEREALGDVARPTARDRAEERLGYLSLSEATASGYAEAPPAYEDAFPPREPLFVRQEELLVPPTNEYAEAHASAYHDVGEETQEYSVAEQIGWVGGAAWQGGAA